MNSSLLKIEADDRRAWMAVLAKAEGEELAALWSAISDPPTYSFLRKPETGLAMVRGRIGGTGQAFNMGEMTMTRAAVQITGEGGEAIAGFSHVAGRDRRHAEIAAALDAMLQDRRWHSMVKKGIVGPLAESQAKIRRKQAAQTAKTRVDFFTLVRGE